MNCITPSNDDIDDAFASAYLSIIQQLPSADYRPPYEYPSTHLVGNERNVEKAPARHSELLEDQSYDDEDGDVPFNMLCGDEMNEGEDPDAVAYACTMVDANQDESIADGGNLNSMRTEYWDDFERGRNAGSPSRAGTRTINSNHKAATEEKIEERDSGREHDLIKSDTLVDEQAAPSQPPKNSPQKSPNKMMSVLSKMKHSANKKKNLMANEPSASVKCVTPGERSTKTSGTAKTAVAGNIAKKKKKLLKLKNSSQKMELSDACGGLENVVAEEKSDESRGKGKSNESLTEVMLATMNEDATNARSGDCKSIKDQDDESKSPTSAIKDIKVDEPIAPASSFSTANETDSTSNISSSSPQESTRKKKGSPQFLRRLKTKRLNHFAIAMTESSKSNNAADDNLETGTFVGALVVNGNGSDNIRSYGTGASETVHLMDLTPENHTTSEKYDEQSLRYDEICNMSSSPPAMFTLVPTPSSGFSQIDTTILGGILTEVPSNQISLPKKSDSDGMICNISPIVRKPSIQKATTNDGIEIDVTGITTATTPDSRDDPNLSRDSASFSDKCRSFLSDVSRTLFPEEIEVLKDNGSVYPVFDEELDVVTIECTIQNSRMIDMTVEEGELNEVNESGSLEDQKLNERACVMERSIGSKQIASSIDAPKSNTSGFNNPFQMDVFKLVQLLGCNGAPPVETSSPAVTAEPDEIDPIFRDFDTHRTELVFDGTSTNVPQATNENKDVDGDLESMRMRSYGSNIELIAEDAPIRLPSIPNRATIQVLDEIVEATI